MNGDGTSTGSAGGRPPADPEVLDCRGKRCPLPVISLAQRLPRVPVRMPESGANLADAVGLLRQIVAKHEQSRGAASATHLREVEPA